MSPSLFVVACSDSEWHVYLFLKPDTLKALLHCAIFSATCLPMQIRDKLLENCTVYHGLSRNLFVARSVARSRTQLYFSQRIAAIENAIAQCITHPATCLDIYCSFNKGACAHFLSFFAPRSIARQVAEKIAQCNGASTPNLGNWQRYIFNHCETSCWENCVV